MMKSIVLNGSPHKHGFTDAIVTYIVHHIPQSKVLLARDISMRDCIHCGYCKSNTLMTKQYTQGCCTIATESDTGVFTELLSADTILWIAPIYFYHLPSVAKAIIDRSQAVYYMQEREEKNHIFYPILHAGRTQGKKLFEGALLTLMYFAKALGFTMGEALLLRGTDEIEHISIESYKEQIIEYCKKNNIIS